MVAYTIPNGRQSLSTIDVEEGTSSYFDPRSARSTKVNRSLMHDASYRCMSPQNAGVLSSLLSPRWTSGTGKDLRCYGRFRRSSNECEMVKLMV